VKRGICKVSRRRKTWLNGPGPTNVRRISHEELPPGKTPGAENDPHWGRRGRGGEDFQSAQILKKRDTMIGKREVGWARGEKENIIKWHRRGGWGGKNTFEAGPAKVIFPAGRGRGKVS